MMRRGEAHQRMVSSAIVLGAELVEFVWRKIVAGNGIYSFGGDGGPAAAALLNRPNGAAAGADGALYIADVYNNRIRKVSMPTCRRDWTAFGHNVLQIIRFSAVKDISRNKTYNLRSPSTSSSHGD